MNIGNMLLALIYVGITMYIWAIGAGNILKESRLVNTLTGIRVVDFLMRLLWFAAFCVLPFGVVRQINVSSDDLWFKILSGVIASPVLAGFVFVCLRWKKPYETISNFELAKYSWFASFGLLTVCVSVLGLIDGGAVLLIEFTQTVGGLLGK